MIDRFTHNGNSQLERKMNEIADAANRSVLLRGDGTFIYVQSGPGQQVIRLDFDAVLRRIPIIKIARKLKVAALPPWNTSNNQIDPWVIANPVLADGSVGSMNIPCGISVPHSVGDDFHAIQVGSNLFGLTYNSSGGVYNASGSTPLPIVWQEIGNPYFTGVHVAVNQSGGNCNVASGSFSTATYDVFNNTSSSVKLASNLTVQKHRIWPGAVHNASTGTICLTNTGLWELLSVDEYPGGVNTC